MWPTRPARSRRRRARTLALAAVLPALAAAACSGSSDGASTETFTTSTPRSTTTATTTTTTAPTTTVLAVGRPDAKETALALYGSWQANDRAGAALVADPPAVDAIFAAPPGRYELYRGCDTGEFETGGCLFRDRSNNNTIQIDLTRRNGNWVVTTAFFSPG